MKLKWNCSRRWVLWLLSELLLIIPILILLLWFGQLLDQKKEAIEPSSSVIEETSFNDGGENYGLYSFGTGDGNDPAGM